MGCPAATKQGCRFYLRTDEDYEGVIQTEMLKDALDLINRQKEEIENLKSENADLREGFAETYNEAKEEIGNLLTEIEGLKARIKDGERKENETSNNYL